MFNHPEIRHAPPDGSGDHLDAGAHGRATRTRARGVGKRRHVPRLLAVAMVVLAGMAGSLSVLARPVSPRITLEVRNVPSTGTDGYTDTTASNGATYSYKYSGGDNDTGDVTFRERGRVTINVHLSGNKYTIDDVGFAGDTHEQLSWVSDPDAGKVAVIQNENSAVQTANYKITVMDESVGATIPCDPKIINR